MPRRSGSNTSSQPSPGVAPLIAKPLDSNVGDIETAPACAMLHSFYTEIEKILKLIAREWDARMPSSDTWHKDLLNQMAVPTNTRPVVITSGLVEILTKRISRLSGICFAERPLR
jgi:hypothetical protein